MPTLTAQDFARLNETRRLQVERYRVAYFKREGELPSDTDEAVNPQWLRVKLGTVDCCLPVKTLTAWGKTFPEAAPLSFALSPGRVTVKRGTSSISLFTHTTEHTAKGEAFRSGGTTPLDAPAVLTASPDGTLTLQLPDLSTELASLRAETTAARKQVTKEKAIAKAKKAERRALDTLTRATDEANQARAVLDSMTAKQAATYARRCMAARRAYRAAIAAPESVPAWLPSTFTESRYEYDEAKQEHADKVETLDTAKEWRELVAAYQAARAAREGYKPRTSWPNWLSAKERKNPEYAHHARPIYGPAFDKLKEAERKALDRLQWFARARFEEYLAAQGLPDALASDYFTPGAYSRARLLLRTWEQRRADLDSQHREAIATREAAEA